jgi:hypothetical protein
MAKRKAKKKQSPQRLAVAGVFTGAAAQRAKAASDQWHGFEQRGGAESVRVTNAPPWMPDNLVLLGDLLSVKYGSDKFDLIRRPWEHDFDPERPPLLVMDADSGTLLVLGVGTRYDVTTAGIANPDQAELLHSLTPDAPQQEIEPLA